MKAKTETFWCLCRDGELNWNCWDYTRRGVISSWIGWKRQTWVSLTKLGYKVVLVRIVPVRKGKKVK